MTLEGRQAGRPKIIYYGIFRDDADSKPGTTATHRKVLAEIEAKVFSALGCLVELPCQDPGQSHRPTGVWKGCHCSAPPNRGLSGQIVWMPSFLPSPPKARRFWRWSRLSLLNFLPLKLAANQEPGARNHNYGPLANQTFQWRVGRNLLMWAGWLTSWLKQPQHQRRGWVYIFFIWVI